MSRAASVGSRLVCLVALGVLANLSGVRAASGRSTLKSALVYYTGAQGPGAQVNALVAQRYASRMPRLIRYALDGLGTPDAQSADLMSYLLFDSSYTRALIDIGYQDAHARIDEIEAFVRN